MTRRQTTENSRCGRKKEATHELTIGSLLAGLGGRDAVVLVLDSEDRFGRPRCLILFAWSQDKVLTFAISDMCDTPIGDAQLLIVEQWLDSQHIRPLNFTKW